MKIERRSDSSIPERQDRPGYSKYWEYVVRINEVELLQRYPRLDQAIDFIENSLSGEDGIDILQITTTRIWVQLADGRG